MEGMCVKHIRIHKFKRINGTIQESVRVWQQAASKRQRTMDGSISTELEHTNALRLHTNIHQDTCIIHAQGCTACVASEVCEHGDTFDF